MPHAYPMMLDVSDRLVVIVGGGTVAARKAAGLIECGATRVRCVAPTFDPLIRPEVHRVESRYAPEHLDGAGLAFAATDDPAVNAAVVRDARARGILVNRADAAEPGDFATPARLHAGAVTVTVSAGSPALAALIRDGLRERWDDRWTRMADAMQVLRPLILRQAGLPETRRHDVFRALATPEAADVLGAGGIDRLWSWLAERFPELSPLSS